MAARTTVTLTAAVPARLAHSLGLAPTDQQAGDVLSLPAWDARALVAAGVARFGSAAVDAAATPTVAVGTPRGGLAPRPGGLRAIAIGDSTTMGDSIHPNGTPYNVNAVGALPDGSLLPVGPFEYRQGPRSWFHHACWASGGRLRPLFNAGQGGDTTTGMLRRFRADVIDKKPDIVFLGDSHNDGSNETLTRANITAMIDMAQAAGIIVVLVTAYPSETSGTSIRLRRTNTWLKKVAQERGLLLSDKYAAVVDPADGSFLAGMTNDGTHASYAGAKAAGARVLADIAPILGGGPEWVPADNTQDINLIGNPLHLTDGGSGAFYGSGTGHTVTHETDATKYAGRARVLNVPGTAGAYRMSCDLTNSARNIAVGDRLKWVGRCRVQGSVAAGAPWMLELVAPGIGTYMTRPVQLVGSTGMDMDWFVFEAEFVVPAGATSLRLNAAVTGGTAPVTLALAQQGLYNLTKLAA